MKTKAIANEIKYYLILFVRKIYYVAFKLTHIKMYKNPERIIPNDTLYCYEWLENPTSKANVKVCPFHKHTYIFPKYAGREVLCMLDGSDCLGDDCKTCGINDLQDE